MSLRQTLISAFTTAAMLVGASSASAQEEQTRNQVTPKADKLEMAYKSKPTLPPVVLKGASSAVINPTDETSTIAQQDPARLQANYQPAPKDQQDASNTKKVENYFGIHLDASKEGDSQEPANNDLKAVIQLWEDNGFVVNLRKDIGPAGPYDGQITVGADPCAQQTIGKNGARIIEPKCEVAVVADTPARTAARLWSMRLSLMQAYAMRKSDQLKSLLWTVREDEGMLNVTDSKTGEPIKNAALTCVVGNTFTNNQTATSGAVENNSSITPLQMSAKLLATYEPCYPTDILAARDPETTNFRKPENWRPLWPRNARNPHYEGPLPPS